MSGFFFIFFVMDYRLSIFLWNCQGCASTKFMRIFKEINSEHKPNIVSLLKSKVNGLKENVIISKLVSKTLIE